MPDFKLRVLSGARWNISASIIKSIANVLQMVVLARFLEPSDFGLMAIAYILIGLGLLVADMGITNAIIQRQNINDMQMSSLFWFNIITGVLTAAALYAASGSLAALYGESRLSQLSRLSAGLFLIIPWGAPFSALLQKRLRFRAVSLIEGISAALGLAVSIVMAARGWGVLSLMMGTMAQYGLAALAFLLFGIKIFRPKLHLAMGDLLPFLKFNIFQTASNLLSYFNYQIDVILIGKYFPSELLGLYSLAKNISAKPLELINPAAIRVSYPVLSQWQSDAQKHKGIYLGLIRNLSSITFPLYVTIYFMAEPVVRLFLGDRWLTVVPLLRILAVYALARSVWQPSGALVLSKGRADLHFYWSLFLLILIPAAITSGSHWGIEAAAWALAASQVLALLPNYYFWIRPVSGLENHEYGRALGLPFLLALMSGLAAMAAALYIGTMVVKTAVYLVVFLVAYYYLNVRYNDGFIGLFRELISPGLFGQTTR